MDDWERHVTPLLQDMGCSSEDAQDDFFNQQDVSENRIHTILFSSIAFTAFVHRYFENSLAWCTMIIFVSSAVSEWSNTYLVIKSPTVVNDLETAICRETNVGILYYEKE